jgi:uncharacterized protein YbjT (DUF2867 family)
MTTRPTTVLVVGATGTIGRLVVHEAIRGGYRHDLASRAQTAFGREAAGRLILRGLCDGG